MGADDAPATDALLERLDRIIVLLEWFAERQIDDPALRYRPNPFDSTRLRQRWQPIIWQEFRDQKSTDLDPPQA